MLRVQETGRSVNATTFIFRIAAMITAILQAWQSRFYLSSPDGVSYLDIAGCYLRGDWKSAVNAYWSPLYSWLIALALWLFKPAAKWEYALVKGVNVFCFLVSLLCYELLLREIRRNENPDESRSALPLKIFVAGAYSIFFWASFYWIRVSSDTPDFLTAAAVYASVALILRVRREHAKSSNFILLGVATAAGYYSKSVFFPLTVILIATCFLMMIRQKDRFRPVVLALVVFGILTAPWVIALSAQKGHITFGESGKLNYAWFVNPGFNSPNHWQGSDTTGKPSHPERLIFQQPPTFEFGSPVPGTYPPWFDPSYWFSGLSVKFNLTRHITVLHRNLLFYYDHFLRALLLGILLFLLIGAGKLESIKSLLKNWILLLPALGGLALYWSAKTHTSMRYIAPFAVLLFLAFLISMRVRFDKTRKVIAISAATILCLAAIVLPLISMTFTRPIPFEIAQAAATAGIQPQERIAIIGDEDDFVYWAHLARVRIVAQVPDAARFKLDSNEHEALMYSLKAHNVDTVVIMEAGILSSPVRWQQIPGTSYRVHFIK